MSRYLRIKDKGIIGRQDGMFECFVFVPGKGWEQDKDNLLMDRIIGYDGEEIGNTDTMNEIEEISEEDALRLTEQ